MTDDDRTNDHAANGEGAANGDTAANGDFAANEDLTANGDTAANGESAAQDDRARDEKEAPVRDDNRAIPGDREILVRDELENNRFALVIDEEYAGFAYYEKFTGMRDFTHTEIEAAFEGQGLSKILIKEALDQAISAGDDVVATCPAVRRFIRKNPEYRDTVRES